MAKKKKLSLEKKEVWMRIPIFIISGFILEVWGFFILIFALVQFILLLVENKKNKELLRMCNMYIIQLYVFMRYIAFLSDKRPFPFGDLEKEIERINKI
ncbi:MAG: DUF4389 domain-containing protein [Candidatus Pacearchaeota archaeon]|nr:DUF4389 domain-containing protein [Candidatus Pacearchaeota archaeon]